MSTTPFLGVIAVLWLALACLAFDSYREMRLRRDAMHRSAANGIMLDFASEETRRALMRAKGWALLFGGVSVIFAQEAYGPIRLLDYPRIANLDLLTHLGLSLVIVSALVFLREALLGRRERRRILDSPLPDHVKATLEDTNRRIRQMQTGLLETATERVGDRPLEQADRDKTDPHREATERRMDEQDARMDRSDARQDASEEGGE